MCIVCELLEYLKPCSEPAEPRWPKKPRRKYVITEHQCGVPGNVYEVHESQSGPYILMHNKPHPMQEDGTLGGYWNGTWKKHSGWPEDALAGR